MAFNQDLRVNVIANTKGFNIAMKAAGAIAVAAFVGAIKVAAEFEKQLSTLRGVSGATEKQMKSLEVQARNLGKATAFTAKEVASAQTELAKLGFTTNQILNSTGGVLDLAAGLGTDLASAAQLTGATLRQFGLSTSETTRVVDILSKSTTESALDFEKLRESLKLVAPVAATAGVSIEETVGILETLANAGISGSTAGTSLRKAFIDLNAAGIPLNVALKNVRDSSDQLGTAVDLVGKRAATAFVVLAKNGYKSVTDFDGAANRLRETMEDNLIGDFDKLKSAVSEMGITVGETTNGPLRGLTQWLTDFINGGQDTLGFLDSLNRAWLYLYETMLLAGRAAEQAYIAIVVNNPLGDGIIPQESLDRLIAFNDELAKVNERIIDLSDGFITNPNSSSSTGGGNPSSSNSSTGGGGGGGSSSGVFGFTPYDELKPFELQIESLGNKIGAFGEQYKNVFTEMGVITKGFVDTSNSATEQLEIGWTTVAASISAAVASTASGEQSFGQIAGGLLKSVGGALISIGVAAVAAGKALAIFGIGIPSIAQGYYAIGIGAALVAGGSILGSSGGSGSGASAATGSTSSPTATPVNVSSDTSNNIPTEIQLVAEGDSLRGVLSQAQYNYAGFNGQ